MEHEYWTRNQLLSWRLVDLLIKLLKRWKYVSQSKFQDWAINGFGNWMTIMNMGTNFVSRIVCWALNSQLRQILLHPQHDFFNLIKIQLKRSLAKRFKRNKLSDVGLQPSTDKTWNVSYSVCKLFDYWFKTWNVNTFCHRIDFNHSRVIDKGSFRVRETLEAWHSSAIKHANDNSKSIPNQHSILIKQ